ncbi:hypothetical protein EVAR_67444_1 [Eumeta japonica]|uniref:Uncharacterized protein n=1 Tax=Eumeta variegata TaxID=151549 RepID=A0A4C2A4K8_EUMVA|nr:hypothetical protein EVAR_67444_1 [Eumeta japonica]
MISSYEITECVYYLKYNYFDPNPSSAFNPISHENFTVTAQPETSHFLSSFAQHMTSLGLCSKVIRDEGRLEIMSRNDKEWWRQKHRPSIGPPRRRPEPAARLRKPAKETQQPLVGRSGGTGTARGAPVGPRGRRVPAHSRSAPAM